MPEKIQFERIRGEAESPENEVIRYEALLPDEIDLVLLSVGEDGHIASLFPHSSALMSEANMAYVSDAPKPPSYRISITPRVILNAKHVIVMASGDVKGQVLARAQNSPDDISELPVRVTIGRTWVLDEEAASSFRRYAPKNHHRTKIIYA